MAKDNGKKGYSNNVTKTLKAVRIQWSAEYNKWALREKNSISETPEPLQMKLFNEKNIGI